MAKKSSFEEQFPDYQLIPAKKAARRAEWAFIWISALAGVIVIPGLLLFLLSLKQVPTPNMAEGVRSSTAGLARVAQMQSQAGNHTEAARSFQTYFSLGGSDANMMALYAYSLSELGRRAEAVEWARKALEKEPQSKAARLINDALKTKN